MEEEIKQISQTIIDKFHPRKIVLFGSRASGEAGPDSDIDLCIIEDNFFDKINELVKIRRSLAKTFSPIDILLFEKSEYEKRKNIFGTVQYEVDKKGVVLYER